MRDPSHVVKFPITIIFIPSERIFFDVRLLASLRRDKRVARRGLTQLFGVNFGLCVYDKAGDELNGCKKDKLRSSAAKCPRLICDSSQALSVLGALAKSRCKWRRKISQIQLKGWDVLLSRSWVREADDVAQHAKHRVISLMDEFWTSVTSANKNSIIAHLHRIIIGKVVSGASHRKRFINSYISIEKTDGRTSNLSPFPYADPGAIGNNK